MTGNSIALFISFVIEDALQELVSTKSVPSFPYQLREEEEADFKKFMNSSLPKTSNGVPLPEDIDRELYLRGPNFCHTARLPAEIRHLGILTESSKVGADSYDKGLPMRSALISQKNGSMPLVYDPGERQSCEEPLNKDYKDYFLVHKSFGWSQLTLPNDAEMKAYGTGAPLRGIISICFRDSGDLDLSNGQGEMKVNGINVTGFTSDKHTRKCKLLRNEKGHIFEPNSDGRFVIRAKENREKSTKYSAFSTFVLW
jgi:hypothetical protein